VILVVKARDLKVGMEVVGPVLFADYGVVTELGPFTDGQVLVTLDGATAASRPAEYEFEVLID